MKSSFPVKKVIRILLLTLAAFLLYLLIGGIIPPLFHHEVSDTYKTDFEKYYTSTDRSSERVLCIDDNTAALIWRLRVIEEAQEELILSSFDFRNDTSGKQLTAALLAAAERGVKVRFFIDGLNGFLFLEGNKYFNAFISNPNVEARFYNSINLLKPWQLNYRMHDKYLIADETVYILGGRNSNDLFLGNYVDKYNIDRDILVYDPDKNSESLFEVKEYFNKIWDMSCNKELTCNGKGSRVNDALDELHILYQEMQDTWSEIYDHKYIDTDWFDATMEVKSVKLLTNPVDDGNKAPELWYSVCRILRDGDNILMQTPYIVANGSMYDDLSFLTGTTDTLQIFTNAVENGANPWGCTDYLNQKDDILETGVEIYEYLGGQSLHTKTILMDENISIVGSYNLDMRSTYLDTEMMLLIDSTDLNSLLRAKISTDIDKSLHVLPDGTETPGRKYSEVDLTFGKKILYGIMRVLILPIRHLL